jgi:DNA-binding transcriptional LysR family regulator
VADEIAAPGVDVADLRLFAVLAEELHFGRAAQRLHLSQSGLTYRVQRLEAELGYQVLARDRRGVRLTAAGAQLLEGARRVLGELARAVEDGERVARGEIATVRVGFVGTALYTLVPEVLRTARRRHPQLRVHVEEHKTMAQLRALQLGQLDLGVVHLPVSAAGIAVAPLSEERVGIALPADHDLVDAPEVGLEQLAGERFVLFPRELEPATFDRYVDACVVAGFAPDVADRATGLQTILALVAAGAGVAFVAESVMARLQRAGVVFRTLDGPAPSVLVGVAHRDGELAPGVALLRDVIADRRLRSADGEVRLDRELTGT